MRRFWDERQRLHAPGAEFFIGALHPAAESRDRVDAILSAIGATEAPGDAGLESIVRVHDRVYVNFLQQAQDQWLAAGGDGDALRRV